MAFCKKLYEWLVTTTVPSQNLSKMQRNKEYIHTSTIINLPRTMNSSLNHLTILVLACHFKSSWHKHATQQSLHKHHPYTTQQESNFELHLHASIATNKKYMDFETHLLQEFIQLWFPLWSTFQHLHLQPTNLPNPSTTTLNGDLKGHTQRVDLCAQLGTDSSDRKLEDGFCLVVSTHLKNISQNGNPPQIGVKIKNVWVATT